MGGHERLTIGAYCFWKHSKLHNTKDEMYVFLQTLHVRIHDIQIANYLGTSCLEVDYLLRKIPHFHKIVQKLHKFEFNIYHNPYMSCKIKRFCEINKAKGNKQVGIMSFTFLTYNTPMNGWTPIKTITTFSKIYNIATLFHKVFMEET